MKFLVFYILTMMKSVGGTSHKRSPHKKFCWPVILGRVSLEMYSTGVKVVRLAKKQVIRGSPMS